MLIETTIKVHNLKVLIEVPPEVHRGDPRVALHEANFASRTLAYLIRSHEPCASVEVRVTNHGNHIEALL